ncbi:Homeobox protein Wariai [Phytophthora cinnamomi]|uniref:Homeobox protein Wariai n=1 Tax=Phytophthora cinnamomi TaxID=4785 RepID=UPI00355A7DA8|nr:Homeobox protein Wariai [Phytophthora cinnamomi]
MPMETDAAAADKAQAFAHRLVEFADYDKCVQFFTERGVDFDRPNDMGWSVLMSVCACGRDDLVGFVVDRTAAVDCATNTNRTTVLHLTAMSKNTRVMEELVATPERNQKLRGIVEQANAHGDSALMMACVAKNVTAVQLLLGLGASMSAVNASGLNALMCAARVGADPRPGAPSVNEMMERSAAIVKILLAHGADVNAVEKSGGNTALHLAVLSENLAAMDALISNAPELDISLRNEAHNTAIDLSKRISGVTSAQMEDLLSLKWAHGYDDGDWKNVLPKKSRRKESPSGSAKTVRSVNRTQRKPSTNKTVKKSSHTPSKLDATAPQSTQNEGTASSKSILAPSTERKNPWANQPTSRPEKPASPRSQMSSDDDEAVSTSISYEQLNGSFQRTFPVAAELEIGVEKFLIASSVSDRELEPNDSLSISQVEALQEAHWQAYHYLNEKKIELTRVLEAQRVEAQFALQQELMQMK